MSIIYSHNVTLDSIFVNNTVTSGTAGKILHTSGPRSLYAYIHRISADTLPREYRWL